MTVSWRTAAGSALLTAGSPERERLEGRLHWVAQRYAEHGVCIDWRPEPEPAPAIVVAGRETSPVRSLPTLQQVAAELPADRVTLLLVRQLMAWNPERQQHARRKGATPGAGAQVAAVRYDDGRGDAVTIFNELLHVLGLTDAELGVAPDHPQHEPSPGMWKFVAAICRSAADRATKRALIIEKERCLAAEPGAARCYGS